MADSKWPAATIVKAETDAFQDHHYYPSVHLNNGAAASLFNDGNDGKQFPFLTTPHGAHDAAAGFDCHPPSFTITPSSESSSRNKRSNGNCALSLLSDNQTPAQAQLMIPTAQPPLGAELLQYGGTAARLPDDGDVVSLTAGMSRYASVGGKQTTSIVATSPAGHTAAAASPAGPAMQLQYHGYYHVSGADGSANQVQPFSSW